MNPLEGPFDTAVVALVSVHLAFSLAAASFVLHFHFRSTTSTSTSTTLRRKLGLLLSLNSLWPVRLLLVFFASSFSFSELLRVIPRRSPSLCRAYLLSSQSVSEPAFFSTLLFLLRASTGSKKSSTVANALISAAFSCAPLLTVEILYFSYANVITRLLRLPARYFLSPLGSHHYR